MLKQKYRCLLIMLGWTLVWGVNLGFEAVGKENTNITPSYADWVYNNLSSFLSDTISFWQSRLAGVRLTELVVDSETLLLTLLAVSIASLVLYLIFGSFRLSNRDSISSNRCLLSNSTGELDNSAQQLTKRLDTDTNQGIPDRDSVQSGQQESDLKIKTELSIEAIALNLQLNFDRTGPNKFAKSEYIVGLGDSIDRIAQELGLDWRDIAKLNKIEAPYTLSLGQVLILPGAKLAKQEYIVRAGDSLESVAKALGVTNSALIEANQLEAPYTLTIGQILVKPQKLKPRSKSKSGRSSKNR